MEIGLVELDQVVAGDGFDRGVLGLEGIGRSRPVNQPVELARSDLGDIVVPALDGAFDFEQGQVDLVPAEGGADQDVGQDLQDPREILLEGRGPDRARGSVDRGLNRSCQGFELLVDLVAGARLGSARAQGRGHEPGQTRLAGRLEDRTGADDGP